MNGRMSLFLRNSIGVMAAMLAGVAAPVATAMDNSLATGVVRFALDTGEASSVVGLAMKLEGESADYLQARLMLASGQHDKGGGTSNVWSPGGLPPSSQRAIYKGRERPDEHHLQQVCVSEGAFVQIFIRMPLRGGA